MTNQSTDVLAKRQLLWMCVYAFLFLFVWFALLHFVLVLSCVAIRIAIKTRTLPGAAEWLVGQCGWFACWHVTKSEQRSLLRSWLLALLVLWLVAYSHVGMCVWWWWVQNKKKLYVANASWRKKSDMIWFVWLFLALSIVGVAQWNIQEAIWLVEFGCEDFWWWMEKYGVENMDLFFFPFRVIVHSVVCACVHWGVLSCESAWDCAWVLWNTTLAGSDT